MNLDWQDSAACTEPGVDPAWFFPDNPNTSAASVANAQQVCARCPVRRPCLQYAIRYHDTVGVFGGVYFGSRRRKQEVA